ncbi:MAG: DNA polymerase III subunit delta, partial [Chordicoccus sp.]
ASLRIRKSDMDYLLLRTGSDMTHISIEVDKLINYCEGKGIRDIGRDEIGAVVSERTENRIFDMVSAVTGGRRKEAMDLYADLLALKEPPMRILFLIGRQFNQLLIIREMNSGGSGVSEIAQKAGMPPFAVRRNLPLAKRYTEKQLRDAVRICVDAETAVKTGLMGDRLSVELVLAQLSGGGA